MRTRLIIADFETYFGSSFKHTARVKYSFDFKNSNLNDIIEGLEQLKQNINAGHDTGLHVGFQITIEDVEHLQGLIQEIITRYKTDISLNLPKKIYTIINNLRQVQERPSIEIAKEVLNEIFRPTEPDKSLSRKDQIKEDARLLSKANALKALQNSAKQSKK